MNLDQNISCAKWVSVYKMNQMQMTPKNKVNSDVSIHLVLHSMKMRGEWMELQLFFIPGKTLNTSALPVQMSVINHISATPNLIDF